MLLGICYSVARHFAAIGRLLWNPIVQVHFRKTIGSTRKACKAGKRRMFQHFIIHLAHETIRFLPLPTIRSIKVKLNRFQFTKCLQGIFIVAKSQLNVYDLSERTRASLVASVGLFLSRHEFTVNLHYNKDGKTVSKLVGYTFYLHMNINANTLCTPYLCSFAIRPAHRVGESEIVNGVHDEWILYRQELSL